MHLIGFSLLVLVMMVLHLVHRAEGKGAIAEIAVAALIFALFAATTGFTMKKKDAPPEPMALLRQRYVEVVSHMPDVYRVPAWTPKDIRDIAEVAAAVGKADSSDPFAAGRAHLHMIRGLADPSTTGGDAKKLSMSNVGFLSLRGRPSRVARS